MRPVLETWKEIPGYEGIYQVSNLGNVRSLDRIVYKNGTGKGYEVFGKMLTPAISEQGYAHVILWNEGKQKRSKVHRLVAIAFIDNPKNKAEVNHIDGNKLNNSLENLEWNSRHENMTHAYKNGLNSNRGSGNSRSILTEEQVRWIRRLMDKVTRKTLAEMLGVDRDVIDKICSYRTWKHVI